MGSLLIGLTGCAATETISEVPRDLVRAPCDPGADLMKRPGPPPKIEAGTLMVEAIANDTVFTLALIRQLEDLQAYIRTYCQNAES